MEGTEDWTVAALIDEENKEWMCDLLGELFTEEEVRRIAAIPLSLRNANDRYVWHFDKKGQYSVRSGYYVFMNSMEVAARSVASSSKNECALRGYWNKIWQAAVPPKVRIFMWRLLRDILPTRSALKSRRVVLPNYKCVFCNKVEETSMHLFFKCGALSGFWMCGPLKLVTMEQSGSCMRDWIFDQIEGMAEEQVNYFFMALWTVWTERNNLVWNDGACRPLWMIQWCSRQLEEYQRVNCKAGKQGKRPLTKWQNPPSGRLKININGAFRVNDGCGGIGVVVRDHEGRGIAAMARPFLHAHSALSMEAEACRAGLLLGIHQGWADIDIESDSATLITALKSEEENLSEISRLWQDSENKVYLIKELDRITGQNGVAAQFKVDGGFWIQIIVHVLNSNESIFVREQHKKLSVVKMEFAAANQEG
ncbi:uncharacterized protein LOC133744218 [Rosa rugosa]|uniref:uncharacterized protein LOC133744218 n=1 Tax=Rosa rugosa TaxID=74645 RepID=UPI002B4093E7|nr:uncharacterized protein LOC133744218 [Rosa rugosa]